MRYAVFLVFLSGCICVSCLGSPISGTYVARGKNFVTMLQLTQAASGQVIGVFSSVELSSEGKISSGEMPITSGMFDGKQLTLTVNPGVLGFHPASLGQNLSGTVKDEAIQFQGVDSNGNVVSALFVRSTLAEFKTYTDQLRSIGDGIVLNEKMLNGAQQFRKTTQDAENWIADAELHAQRVPKVKEAYQEIEHKIQSLVTRERSTTDSVARSQIAVMVSQADVDGIQADNSVNSLWDMRIVGEGTELFKSFNNWDGNCGSPDDLRARQKRGATSQTVEAWESSCRQALAERDKFIAEYKRIMAQRAELKSFQATAGAHRQALVEEAARIE